MKKITFILLVSLISGTAFAQDADATAQVNAQIVQPIQIKVENNMNFGSIATDGEVGTVVLNANSDATADASSTASLVESTRNAALFLVKAAENYGYSITLPSSDVILNSGDDEMILNSFDSNLGTTSTGTGADQLLYVGGTLNVGATQPAGIYNGEVTVSVSYE